MAELVQQIITQVAENATEEITNKKIPASPEGMLVAYTSLVIMAVLPIFFGSRRSVSHHEEIKVRAFSHSIL
jgi:minor histocompatibility antigen H13